MGSGPGDGLRVFVRGHAREEAKGIVLIDSPDIDSTHEQNRIVATALNPVIPVSMYPKKKPGQR